VRWFTGGTILADGRVALILDMGALLRADARTSRPLRTVQPLEAPQAVSVMVVDDSITVRKVTSRLLERHDMQVLTAKDGVDAVTLLQEHRPDVMLLDIEMPRMDGYQLTATLRAQERHRDLPIVIVTSRASERHRRKAFELGADEYLVKPLREAQLVDCLRGLLAPEGRSTH
jgi:chemosensory pili system protein ChpA (sensor histidine kinase/response regulator)